MRRSDEPPGGGTPARSGPVRGRGADRKDADSRGGERGVGDPPREHVRGSGASYYLPLQPCVQVWVKVRWRDEGNERYEGNEGWGGRWG